MLSPYSIFLIAFLKEYPKNPPIIIARELACSVEMTSTKASPPKTNKAAAAKYDFLPDNIFNMITHLLS